MRPPIESLAGADAEPLHGPAQIVLARFHQMVEMIAHQHGAVQGHPETLGHPGQVGQKPLPVGVLPKNVAPLVAASCQMVPGSGQVDLQRTCHASFRFSGALRSLENMPFNWNVPTIS
jgi:hypothetical protein